MQRVTTTHELRAAVKAWRGYRRSIGFVPTMGALHEGHLSLVRQARRAADRVVASVFVNPAQFGPGEDFERYPRQPDEDAELLRAAGCHLVFEPTPEVLYPADNATWVSLEGPPAEGLEAAARPGHFRGVATVVAKLLGLVTPDVAVFGEKDAQQLAVVRRMVADLALGVEILAGATVREPDGLAMSSRNAYLSADERQAATVLHRALEVAAAAIEAGERDADAVRRRLADTLAGEPLARVEYAEVVDPESFQPVATITGPVILPLAVHIGTTRLIDNLRVTLARSPGEG